MNIGEVAKLTGLSDKTLRYYESIGIVSSARSANGYRVYTEQHVADLQFLASARQSGFSLDECKTLISLMRNTNRHSKDVKVFVTQKIEQLDQQIQALSGMKASLETLANRCKGNDESDCAILDGLARHENSALKEKHND